MDPASILGAISAAGAIVAAITKTVHDLCEIRGKFEGADTTIGLLISELSTVKAALLQIEDWANFNFNGQLQENVAEAVEISLDGCKESMDLLAKEVTDLVGDPENIGAHFFRRARTVWNDSSMKDHQHRMHTQITALQLLLQAVAITSLPGQAAMMREPKTIQIFEKVKDDTSSVRAIARSSQMTSPTFRSHTQSTIGSTTFEIDHDIADTAVYRTRGAHAVAKHNQNAQDAEWDASEGPPSTHLPLPRELKSLTAMQTRDSMSTREGSERYTPTTPTICEPASSWQKPRPYENSPVSDPLEKRANGRPVLRLHTPSPESSKKSVSFRERLKRLSPTNRSQNSPTTPTSPPGARRGLRRSPDKELNTSIDFTSADGLSAPAIVRAAQSGSSSEIEQLIDQGADLEAKHKSTGRTALAVAAHCGNEDICQILIHSGARVNTVDSMSMSPLHLAALNGNCGSLECLLREGANIEAPGPRLMTPLQLAVENEFVEAATLLLQRRAKVQARDVRQLTSLHTAAKAGDKDMVQVLLDFGADVEAKDAEFQAPIHHAAAGGFGPIVEALLNKKANIECAGSDLKTPLMCASETGAEEVVKLLLKRKASVKAKGDGGMTALHYCAYNGHREVVDVLTQKKSTVNTRTADGRTALHLAIMTRSFSAADLLIRKDASIEAMCNSAMRPLHYACEAIDKNLVQLLLGNNADIEAEAYHGQRPLHIATRMGSLPLVQVLLDRGAQIEARDAVGERALCIAAMYGHLDVLQHLLDRGAAMRLKFRDGPSHEDSPLCIACKYGHRPVVLELMVRGASLRQKDEQSWQPLRYAAFYGWPDVVELLLANGVSISGLDPNGCWGFSKTSQRLGFAKSTDIDEDRKSLVLQMLRQAETAEQEQTSTNGAVAQGFEATPQQDGPAEIDDENTTSPTGPAGPVPNQNSVSGIAAMSSSLTPQQPCGFYSHAASENFTGEDSSYPNATQVREFYSTPMHPSHIISPISSPFYSSDPISGVSPMPRSYYSSLQETDRIRDLTCGVCSARGKPMPDLACSECRQAVFIYNYSLQAIAAADAAPTSIQAASVYELPARNE